MAANVIPVASGHVTDVVITPGSGRSGGKDHSTILELGGSPRQARSRLAQVAKHQCRLLLRSLLITLTTMFAVASFGKLIDIIEEATFGEGSWEHWFSKRVGHLDEHMETFSGWDVVVLLFVGLLMNRLGIIFLSKFYRGNKTALYVVVVTLPISCFVFWLLAITTRSYSNLEMEVTTKLYGIAFVAMYAPHLFALSMRKGLNKKWCGRAARRLFEPIVTVVVGLACSYYITLNDLTENKVFTNIMVMSVGYPMYQLSLRLVQNWFVQKAYSTDLDASPGPNVLWTESILILPGFVAMLNTASQTSYYVSMSLSFVLEIAETSACLYFYKSKINSDQKLKSFLTIYFSNIEQAERNSLLTSIGLILFSQNYSQTVFPLRAVYAIILEFITDIIKEQICRANGLNLDPKNVDMTTTSIALYTCMSACGCFLIMSGMQTRYYIQ